MKVNSMGNTVSIYKTCYQTHPVESLEFIDVLDRLRCGYWQDAYLQYKNGKIKKTDVPCFTTAGMFGEERKIKGLLEHSGFICIDIDGKNNTGVDLLGMKDTLYGDRYSYAGHLSISGSGIALYVRINGEKHFESFLGLEKYYADEYGIIIDPSGKDVTRLRYVVYDPDLHLNEKSKKFTDIAKKAEVEFVRKEFVFGGRADMEYILEQIESKGLDLTGSYHEGVKIAFALNKEFGDDGERYFQRICQFRKGYNPEKTALKYTQCRGSEAVTIASFLWIAKNAGLMINAPMTKSVVKAARYAKKSIADGTFTSESARQSAMKGAVEMVGMDAKDAEKVVDAVFSGKDDAVSGESKDEVYEFLTKDIAALGLQYNLIEDCVECDGDPLADRFVDKFTVKSRTRYGSKNIMKSHIEELISSSAKDFNPIEDFIAKNKSKRPKGCIDAVIDSIKGDVFGLTETEAVQFRRYYIRKWLIGAVSGWVDKYSLLTLILVGEQMINKTNWFRFLLPESLRRYYAESKMDGTPDHLVLMTTKAIIMDDEFSGKSRKESALLKELSSKQEITLRKPYARRAQTHKRIAALCGTTNDDTILNDLTGNRRIIPINVTGIDFAAFNAVDKDDLWIEVYHELMEGGDSWMMTKEDVLVLDNASERFKEPCSEEELLLKYFAPAVQENAFPNWMTNTEILVGIESKLNGGSIRLTKNKLGSALKLHGYAQVIKKFDGITKRVYDIQWKNESVLSTQPTPF